MEVSTVSEFISDKCFHFTHFLVEDELQASQLVFDVLQSFMVESPTALSKIESTGFRNEFYSRIYKLANTRRNHFKVSEHLDLSGRAAFFLVYEHRLSIREVSKITMTPEDQVLLKVVHSRSQILKANNDVSNLRAAL